MLAARRERQLPLDDGAIWLWNAQPDGLSVPVGEPIESEILSTIPPGSPLRVLRIESDAWQEVLEPVLEEPPESALPDLTDLGDMIVILTFMHLIPRVIDRILQNFLVRDS